MATFIPSLATRSLIYAAKYVPSKILSRKREPSESPLSRKLLGESRRIKALIPVNISRLRALPEKLEISRRELKTLSVASVSPVVAAFQSLVADEQDVISANFEKQNEIISEQVRETKGIKFFLEEKLSGVIGSGFWEYLGISKGLLKKGFVAWLASIPILERFAFQPGFSKGQLVSDALRQFTTTLLGKGSVVSGIASIFVDTFIGKFFGRLSEPKSAFGKRLSAFFKFIETMPTKAPLLTDVLLRQLYSKSPFLGMAGSALGGMKPSQTLKYLWMPRLIPGWSSLPIIQMFIEGFQASLKKILEATEKAREKLLSSLESRFTKLQESTSNFLDRWSIGFFKRFSRFLLEEIPRRISARETLTKGLVRSLLLISPEYRMVEGLVTGKTWQIIYGQFGKKFPVLYKVLNIGKFVEDLVLFPLKKIFQFLDERTKGFLSRLRKRIQDIFSFIMRSMFIMSSDLLKVFSSKIVPEVLKFVLVKIPSTFYKEMRKIYESEFFVFVRKKFKELFQEVKGGFLKLVSVIGKPFSKILKGIGGWFSKPFELIKERFPGIFGKVFEKVLVPLRKIGETPIGRYLKSVRERALKREAERQPLLGAIWQEMKGLRGDFTSEVMKKVSSLLEEIRQKTSDVAGEVSSSKGILQKVLEKFSSVIEESWIRVRQVLGQEPPYYKSKRSESYVYTSERAFEKERKKLLEEKRRQLEKGIVLSSHVPTTEPVKNEFKENSEKLTEKVKNNLEKGIVPDIHSKPIHEEEQTKGPEKLTEKVKNNHSKPTREGEQTEGPKKTIYGRLRDRFTQILQRKLFGQEELFSQITNLLSKTVGHLRDISKNTGEMKETNKFFKWLKKWLLSKEFLDVISKVFSGIFSIGKTAFETVGNILSSAGSFVLGRVLGRGKRGTVKAPPSTKGTKVPFLKKLPKLPLKGGALAFMGYDVLSTYLQSGSVAKTAKNFFLGNTEVRSFGGRMGNAISQGLQYAALGSFFGPMGALIGGLAGAAVGAFAPEIKSLFGGWRSSSVPTSSRVTGREKPISVSYAPREAATRGLGKISEEQLENLRKQNFGVLTALGETGTTDFSKGMSVVSTRPGDVSYGTFQFTPETMKRFLERSGFSDMFSGHVVGTESFRRRWQEIVKSNPEIEKKYYEFAMNEYLIPAQEQAKKLGIDIEGSRALNEVLFSRAIQHGVGGLSRIMERAFKGLSPEEIKTLSKEEIITRIYKEIINNADKYFSKRPPREIQATVNRLVREHDTSIRWLKKEEEEQKMASVESKALKKTTEDMKKIEEERQALEHKSREEEKQKEKEEKKEKEKQVYPQPQITPVNTGNIVSTSTVVNQVNPVPSTPYLYPETTPWSWVPTRG